MTTPLVTANLDGCEHRVYWALADCWTLDRRDLTHLTEQPSPIAWQLRSRSKRSVAECALL